MINHQTKIIENMITKTENNVQVLSCTPELGIDTFRICLNDKKLNILLLVSQCLASIKYLNDTE